MLLFTRYAGPTNNTGSRHIVKFIDPREESAKWGEWTRKTVSYNHAARNAAEDAAQTVAKSLGLLSAVEHVGITPDGLDIWSVDTRNTEGVVWPQHG